MPQKGFRASLIRVEFYQNVSFQRFKNLSLWVGSVDTSLPELLSLNTDINNRSVKL